MPFYEILAKGISPVHPRQPDQRDDGRRSSGPSAEATPVGNATVTRLPDVWRGGFASGLLALRLRPHLSGTSFARVSGVRRRSQDGPLLPVWRYAPSAVVSMRVTERDQELLMKLAVCRWLMASQVKALCFPNVSVEMARRRLRLLARHRFVRTWRIGQLNEAIHALGPEGKRLLPARGRSQELRLERRPPRHFEHSFAINDLRIWIERCARLEGFTIGFFYACWELADVNWNAPIIPDAIASSSYECVPATRVHYTGFRVSILE
jgi:hypothetical protein